MRFLFYLYSQIWTNCALDVDMARLGAENLRDTVNFSGVHILPCKKEKIVRSTNLQWNRKNNEQVTVNSK